MAVPIIPILKKLAVAVLTDKKTRKRIFGILLGIVIIVTLPIMAIIGVFAELSNINTSEVEQILSEYESTVNEKNAEIEDLMTARGFSALQIEEAQTLYAFALYDFGEEEKFIEKLADCYTLEEQTDEALIQKVNETFGTEYLAEEYANLMQDVREKYEMDEKERGE